MPRPRLRCSNCGEIWLHADAPGAGPTPRANAPRPPLPPRAESSEPRRGAAALPAEPPTQRTAQERVQGTTRETTQGSAQESAQASEPVTPPRSATDAVAEPIGEAVRRPDEPADNPMDFRLTPPSVPPEDPPEDPLAAAAPSSPINEPEPPPLLSSQALAQPPAVRERVTRPQPPAARQRRSRAGLFAGLAIAAGCVVIAASALVLLRQHVVAVVPDAAPLYAAVGLDASTPGEGLEIAPGDVDSTVETVEGRQDLVISGIVRNVSNQPRPVPLIQWSLIDANGTVVQSVVVEPPRSRLGPGEQMSVDARIENRSPEGRQIQARWVAAE